MTSRKFLLTLLVLTMFAAFTVNLAAAATQTLTGVVTDDMCGRGKHMMPGKSDAECVRACVKAGAKYALLVGDKLYILNGKTRQIDALAGKRASVTGEVTGTTITVASAAAAK